ncbi:MAG TPA: PQQ-binding-like beta-propeller repeat protein, partial [Terriglobales bacterium]|nr:PQQ-binding-like beta-propeller repeat protein [Terriglobales bacterium]
MRMLLWFALLALLAACGGGGGGGSSEIPQSWSQFHRDGQRRGFGTGIVMPNDGTLRSVAVDARDVRRPGLPLAPIVASPVVDLDDVIYVASENGTVLAVAPDDLSTRWVTSRCDLPRGQQQCPAELGPIVSTPALLQVDNTTTVVVASRTGSVYFFEIDDRNPVPECVACFTATIDTDVRDEFGPTATVEIVSSPTLRPNLVTGTIAQVLIGARITVPGDGDTPASTAGKLYSINNDGSLRWQFPAPGEAAIAPISASPTLGVGEATYIASDDGVLYMLTGDGLLKREVEAGELAAPDDLFVPSAVTSAAIYLNGADGIVRAFNHDGSLRWQSAFPGESFLGTLAASSQSIPTTTPTESGAPPPTPTPLAAFTGTPTATFTPQRITSNLFAISESGRLIILNEADGEEVAPSRSMPDEPVRGTVFTSPAISGDRLLVFTASDSRVYVYDTATLTRPRICVGGSNEARACEDADDCP